MIVSKIKIEEAMDANAKKIRDILSSDGGAKYRIPPYQRPYRWDPEDVEKLIQDIRESCDAGEKEYFIGSMICIKKEGAQEVIDGQQRIVTLTLILKHLSNLWGGLCDENDEDDMDLKRDLRARVIHKVMWRQKQKLPKPVVEVRKSESEIYSGILKDEPKDAATNAQKFYVNNWERINECLSADMGKEGLAKLIEYLLDNVFIVFVEVDDRTSAFRLFNVLNNRGMPLNDADLVKNLLFEKAAEKSVSEKVEEQWKALEHEVQALEEKDDAGEKAIFDFLRLHIISEKDERDRVIKILDKETNRKKKVKVYEYYQHRLDSGFDNDPQKMMDMLIKSAEHYAEILKGERGIIKTSSLLKNFDYYEWLPALMAFLNKKGDDGFREFVEFFEKAYMQTLLRRERGGADVVCYYALEAINNGKSNDEIMAAMRGRIDNDKFEESLDRPDFYDRSRRLVVKLVAAVLVRVGEERLEGGNPKEYGGVRPTIEHIMPQNTDDEYWKSRFTEEQHQEWLHKLGNLTLLSQRMNAAARNSGFDKKKEAYERNKQKCPYEITRDLYEIDEWDMQVLQNRHKKLKGEIVALWGVDK